MLIDLEQYKLIVESSPTMIWRSNLSTECDCHRQYRFEMPGKGTNT